MLSIINGERSENNWKLQKQQQMDFYWQLSQKLTNNELATAFHDNADFNRYGKKIWKNYDGHKTDTD